MIIIVFCLHLLRKLVERLPLVEILSYMVWIIWIFLYIWQEVRARYIRPDDVFLKCSQILRGFINLW